MANREYLVTRILKVIKRLTRRAEQEEEEDNNYYQLKNFMFTEVNRFLQLFGYNRHKKKKKELFYISQKDNNLLSSCDM